LIGPAGMGKTHTVEHVLQRMEAPYKKYGGHITVAQTFQFMYENSESLIFFDDCSNIISNREIIEQLKQALQDSGKRMLHYRSTGSAVDVDEFEFKGQIIMAFNKMQAKDPNVQAIISRAPTVEMKYSFQDVISAMYQIAKNPGGILKKHEKIVVTREIERYADSTMDVSLRTQQQAFKIYNHCRKIHDGPNKEWKKLVHNMIGKKERSWIYEFVKDLVGTGKIKRSELAKEIAIHKGVTPRTAQRRIKEFLEIGEIYQNKKKAGHISIKPFKGR
jgi:cell fate (sporulation/competence/biofilm development) regulator YlbF (YheA/YmcA/DUF963 family)